MEENLARLGRGGRELDDGWMVALLAGREWDNWMLMVAQLAGRKLYG